MTINVFAYVSGEESSFKMVSDYAFPFIDAVGAKIGVITQERLRGVRGAFSRRGGLAFFANHRDGTIAAGELCGNVARLVVNQNAQRNSRQTGIGIEFPIRSSALARDKAPTADQLRADR